jgi:hypothetical protein
MDGGQDVFVHVSALERSGIEGLSEAQTVGVVVVEGGPLSVQEAGRVGKLFIEDVAIIGGRLFVFVRDAGPISIDRR